MEFEETYEITQTDTSPVKWQIVRKTDNKIMGTYDTIGPLMESLNNFKLRFYWNKFKTS
jgi:hypothetical protein